MNLQETSMRMNDELSSLVTKAMVSAVVAMALLVMATVLVFHSGGTIV